MSLGNKRTYDIRVRSPNGDVSPHYEGLPLDRLDSDEILSFTPQQLKKFIAFCIVRGRNDPNNTPADAYGFIVTITNVTTERRETIF